MDERPRLLIVLNQQFWKSTKGSSVRIRLLIQHLSKDYQIDVFYLKTIRQAEIIQLRNCSPDLRRFFSPALSVVEGVRALASHLLRRKQPSLPAGIQPTTLKDWKLSHVLRRILKEQRYDVVLFEYIWTARLINSVTTGFMPAERWVDTHDVMHQRAATSHSAGVSMLRSIDEKTESAYLEHFSTIIAIQPEEEAEFRRMLPHKRVVTIPVTLQPEVVAGGLPQGVELGSHGILHVSSRDPIAVRSLQWFLDEIWPGVLREFPLARLHVIGGICDSFQNLDLEGVRFHGYVEHLAPFYLHSKLTINPCLAGSGVKIKTLESLAYGRTVITTPFGAQGIDRRANPELKVAEPQAFGALLKETLGA